MNVNRLNLETGAFSVTLIRHKITEKKEIHTTSVQFDNVKFKLSRQFRKEVRKREKPDGAEYCFITSSTRYSEEERFALLNANLKEYSVSTCKEYCELASILKIKAGSELRQ